MKTSIVEFGAGSKVSAPGEYPCVRRVRHRRLLTYLWLQGFQPTFQALTQETDAHLCGLHLRQLVARGLWSDALTYLRRFFNPDACTDAYTLDLVWFLNACWVLDNMGGAAAKHGAMMTAVYYHDVSLSTYLSRNAKLCSIINTMANSHQFRLSLDWQLVRRKASLIVYELLLQSPELRRLLILPRETLNPQLLLPIGPRRPRRHVRKQARRPTSTAMARLYLNTKRSLFSSKSPHPALLAESLKRVADLIDQCLKDGKRPELHKGRLLQSTCIEGAPGATLLQPTSGALTNPANNNWTSSVKNADAATFTGQAKHFCFSSAANSGTPVSQPTQNFGISSATNAGAPSAPFFKNTCGTLTNPATKIGTSAVTSAGASTFTCLAKKSRISSELNSGTINHLSDDGCCTNSACQHSAPGKKPRSEVTNVEKDDPDAKMQRTCIKLDENGFCTVN